MHFSIFRSAIGWVGRKELLCQLRVGCLCIHLCCPSRAKVLVKCLLCTMAPTGGAVFSHPRIGCRERRATTRVVRRAFHVKRRLRNALCRLVLPKSVESFLCFFFGSFDTQRSISGLSLSLIPQASTSRVLLPMESLRDNSSFRVSEKTEWELKFSSSSNR